MRKKITTFVLLLVSVMTITLVAWAQNPNRRQTNTLEIVEAERAFARAAATKNTRDAFLEFLADDGIIFQPGPVNGKQFWRERPVRKGLLSWRPIFADVSSAGDLGYTTGPWEFRPNGPDDKPVAFGQYFTIWKRQADGSWKVALDRGITHPQPPVATERLQFPEDEGDVRNKRKAEADRALLLKLEAEFSRASMSRDTTKAFQSYLAEDVRLFREDSFPVVGKRAALAMVSAKPGVLSWQPTVADISRSSDLGYSYGTYEFKPTSTAVKPEKGNYLRVWKRQAGNKWRVVIDIMNPVPSS